jgi:predicted DNA-binding transcriptional regulator AlpA
MFSACTSSSQADEEMQALSHNREVNMESLLTENEVSACLKVSLACLRRWRLVGDGPQYVKVNNLVRYREADIKTWVEQLPSAGNGRRLGPKSIVRTKLAATA